VKASGRAFGRWLFSCCLAFGFDGVAQQSVNGIVKEKPYSLLLTLKLHSTGHSPFSGTYINHHPNGELGLLFKYKHVGAFLNKNADFSDGRSGINYTTVGIFKSFVLGKSVKITPYLGYVLKQSYSFIDDNSDAWTCFVLRANITHWLAFENTALFGNLIRHHANASFANRMNAVMSIGKFKVDVYAWYTHSLKSKYPFMSASAAITSPDWIITKSISARVQVAVMQQISSRRPDGCMHGGGLVSLIVPVDLSMNNSASLSEKMKQP
jgi:hypothetical protein